MPLSRVATDITGNGALSHHVGSKGLLEWGAREKTTGRKPNKANPLVFFYLTASPDNGT